MDEKLESLLRSVQLAGLGASVGASAAMGVALTREYLGGPDPGLHTQQTVGVPDRPPAQMWSIHIGEHAWPELAAVLTTAGICAVAFRVWRESPKRAPLG